MLELRILADAQALTLANQAQSTSSVSPAPRTRWFSSWWDKP